MAVVERADNMTGGDDGPLALELAGRIAGLEAGIGAMSAADVDAASRLVGQLQSWTAGVMARLTQRSAVLCRAGQRSDPTTVAKRSGLGHGDAKRAARRGEALGAMPEAQSELAGGRLGVGHADVLARQADRLEGVKRRRFETASGELARRAVDEAMPVGVFEGACRDIVDEIAGDDGVAEQARLRERSKAGVWKDKQSGMWVLRGEFDPVRGEQLATALKAEVSARKAAGSRVSTSRHRDRVSADALHALVCGGRKSAGVGRPSIAVLIGLDPLRAGVRETGQTCETEAGTPLPVETVRRMACEGDILPIVLDGRGQALDVGRSQRLATPAQRRALRAMYPTCGMDPDCGVSFDLCEIHHVDWWEHGGRSDLDRMVPACTAHHHQVHELGWTPQRDATDTWRLQPPQRPPP